MKQRTKILIGILAVSYVILLVVPVSVFAEDTMWNSGLIPCGTKANPNMCTVCDFFKLIQNIINFFLYVSAPLTTLAAIYIGFLFMFSGGSPQKVTEAKGKLWMVIIGLFWILGSWLVINTVLNMVASKSAFPWKPWSEINCEVSDSQSSQTTQPAPPHLPTIIPDTLSEQQVRNKLSQGEISINKPPCPTGVCYQNVSGGCTSVEGLKSTTVDAVIQLRKDCNSNLLITAGSECGHTAGTVSHGSGNKVDFQLNTALNNCIEGSGSDFNKWTPRTEKDGTITQQWRRVSDGAIFAKEGDHWDATFVR